MIPYGPLFAVMEFGVGLAGFAGVAFAVIHRGDLGTVNRFRIRNLLSCALGAAFLAFVPVLLDSAGVRADDNWRLTSVLVAVCYVAGWVLALNRARAMSAEERASMSRPVWAVNLAHSLVGLLLLVGNVVGWPFDPQIAPVLFSLLSLLVQAAINFVRLVSRLL